MEEEQFKNSLREAIALATEPAEVYAVIGTPEQRHDMAVCDIVICGLKLTLWADCLDVDDPEDLCWRFVYNECSYSLHHLPAILLNVICDRLSVAEDTIRDIDSAMAWATVRASGV